MKTKLYSLLLFCFFALSAKGIVYVQLNIAVLNENRLPMEACSVVYNGINYFPNTSGIASVRIPENSGIITYSCVSKLYLDTLVRTVTIGTKNISDTVQFLNLVPDWISNKSILGQPKLVTIDYSIKQTLTEHLVATDTCTKISYDESEKALRLDFDYTNRTNDNYGDIMLRWASMVTAEGNSDFNPFTHIGDSVKGLFLYGYDFDKKQTFITVDAKVVDTEEDVDLRLDIVDGDGKVSNGSSAHILLNTIQNLTTYGFHLPVDKYSESWFGVENGRKAGEKPVDGLPIIGQESILLNDEQNGIVGFNMIINDGSKATTALDKKFTVFIYKIQLGLKSFEGTNDEYRYGSYFDELPIISSIPEQRFSKFNTSLNLDLNNYISDKETPDSQMSWWADGNNLTVNIINGIATVTCPSDWFGTENIWFIATDSANHSAYVEVLFSKSSNTPPVVSSIPSDTITGTESFNTIALNDYVTDAETSDEKIVWTTSKSEYLTVTIANNIATVTPNPLWNGEETIMFIAKDEQGDADITYATFVRTNAPGSPTGKPIGTFWTEKTLVSVGTPVSFKLNQIGATSYQWTFEGGTPATSQTVDASVAYSAPGIYSVSLVMKNSFGDSTIIKKNIITVMGIKQPDTVICKGTSVTFSLVNATSVDSLVWSNGKKTATITVSPIEETTYAVTLYKGLFSYKDNVKVSIPRPVDLGKDTTVCAGQTVKLYPGIYKKYVWSNLETDESIDAKEIGIYKVSVTDAYSCISEDSVKITALLPLPLTGLPATEHICTAGTKVLTAKNGTEYQWKTDFDSQVWNESSITVSAAGAYIVTVKGENGCSVNDTVTVSSVASPVISISPADTAICPANTVKLTASGAAQYAWDNSVVNGTAFTPAASKTYSVTATDEYGCTSTASAQVTVRATYAQQIGVATFGEDGSSTIVAWNPVRGKKISHVDLQKFNDSSAKFETLKSFGEKDLTYYVDKQADGNLKSYSYRLISYDSLCPAAPATSVIHSTIHLSRDLSVDANMVGLKWNAYAGLDVKKYFIYAIQDGKNVDTLEEGVVDAKKQFYTVTYPRHVNGNKYQIAFDLPEKLYTSTLKNESGPFSQSMSNLSEAIILSDIITDAATVSLYPVPAHDYLDVQSSDVPVSCTVLSMKGESVLTVKGASRIDISQLPAGEYSLRIELSNATVTKLFVKQ